MWLRSASSLKRKLSGVIMLTCGIALALAGTGFVLNDLLAGRQALLHRLATQADIIGANSKTALIFDDRQTAEQILSALSAEPSIAAAAIYSQHNTLLAAYPERGEDGTRLPSRPQADGHRLESGHLHVSRPVLLDGQRIGTVYLRSSLAQFYSQLRHQIVVIVMVLLGSYLTALLLSSKWQGMVSGPILRLAETARTISREQNYALRGEGQGDGDEVDVLIEAFNDMLTQIQERDQKLERYTAHLEDLVATRTAELQRLNSQLQTQARDLERQVARRTQELRKANEQLLHQAYHDTLTSLPNRALFNDRLTQAIFHAQRRSQVLAVLFLDLDRFKFINDTLGHAVGDQLLRRVAGRLQAAVRKEDTIARLGGDEFTVLLDTIGAPEDAETVAHKVIKGLGQPLQCDGHELHVSTSIGIAIYPKDGGDAQILMRNADIAMYIAKQQGRNRFRFYAEAMNAASLERLQMENRLRHALQRREFVLHYQPQRDPHSGSIVGVEALLRWAQPEGGLLPPAVFVPLLEETGLIAAVGEWILEEVCAQARTWINQGIAPIDIAVNCSSRQFIQPTLAQIIERILSRHALEPRLLTLEITESVLMENAEEATATLRRVSALGIRLAIDDFGTGHSSLSSLKRFPITAVKIDRSFVRDATTDPEDAAIVKTVIAMAHNLGLKAIAEGVETPEVLDFLRVNRCDVVQGFLLGQPMAADEVSQLLVASGLRHS